MWRLCWKLNPPTKTRQFWIQVWAFNSAVLRANTLCYVRVNQTFLLNCRAMMVWKVAFPSQGERFGVVQVKIPVFWDIIPCTLVIMFWRSLLPPLHCVYSEIQFLCSEGMNVKTGKWKYMWLFAIKNIILLVYKCNLVHFHLSIAHHS